MRRLVPGVIRRFLWKAQCAQSPEYRQISFCSAIRATTGENGPMHVSTVPLLEKPFTRFRRHINAILALTIKLNLPDRRRPVVTVFATLFLAFTVLGWGTGYKVSLYDAPGSGTHVLKANLLSPKERLAPPLAVTVSAPEQKSTAPTLWAFAAIAVLALCGQMGARQVASAGTEWPQTTRYSAFFSFRPPPASFQPRA